MKLQIINQFPMQWEKHYRSIFPDAQWSKAPSQGYDHYLFMWCNEITGRFINQYPKKGKYIVFVRRYEYYTSLENLDWKKVDAVIMVNDYLADGFKKRTSIQPHVIYNGVNTSDWTYRERKHGKSIAWVGFINQKKNLPLAIQILAELPDDYELHVAGEIQDGQVWDYVQHMAKAIKRKVYYNGHIPHEHMDAWLEDKNYILSTAISEGSPNHVIEAMAKGIKPIVHNWPGAVYQFLPYVFTAIRDAVTDILPHSPYDSDIYRAIVDFDFGTENYEKVKKIVCEA